MFDSITAPEFQNFSYQFEKLRNAIGPESQTESNVHAATQLGLNIIEKQFCLFRKELEVAGHFNTWEYELKPISGPSRKCATTGDGIKRRWMNMTLGSTTAT
ncbi:hypothetical protein [Ferrimonas kyonanensis]|uniref:hypothetical protein n=1 Tax=Ferrimonas kyonanensis TaxID=364763 RepID=UPI0006860D35|nr:hypothetical protein [Ferrimonas kyonanensis]